MKKKRIDARKHMKGLIIFLMIFILGFIIFYRTGYAKDQEKGRNNIQAGMDSERPGLDTKKLYKTIEIRQGDSLWLIAQEYMDEHYDSVDDYIQDLKDINHLETDCIEAGNYLTVAYYL